MLRTAHPLENLQRQPGEQVETITQDQHDDKKITRKCFSLVRRIHPIAWGTLILLVGMALGAVMALSIRSSMEGDSRETSASHVRGSLLSYRCQPVSDPTIGWAWNTSYPSTNLTTTPNHTRTNSSSSTVDENTMEATTTKKNLTKPDSSHEKDMRKEEHGGAAIDNEYDGGQLEEKGDTTFAPLGQTLQPADMTPESGYTFGAGLSLSDDGRTLAVGSMVQSDFGVLSPKSNAVRVYFLQQQEREDELTNSKGIFQHSPEDVFRWEQLGSDITYHEQILEFGSIISLSGDGSTLAIGLRFHNYRTGKVVVYKLPRKDDLQRHGNSTPPAILEGEVSTHTWIQKGQEVEGIAPLEQFGLSIDLSHDGNTLAVGAKGEGPGGGRAVVFAYNHTNATWNQRGADVRGDDRRSPNLGSRVALSSEGNTLAIGTAGWRSNQGMASVYSWVENDDDVDTEERVSTTDGEAMEDASDGSNVNGVGDGDGSWVQLGKAIYGRGTNQFGADVDLTPDGRTLVVGAMGRSPYLEVFRWDGVDWSTLGSAIEPTNGESKFGSRVSIASSSPPESQYGGDVDIYDELDGQEEEENLPGVTLRVATADYNSLQASVFSIQRRNEGADGDGLSDHMETSEVGSWEQLGLTLSGSRIVMSTNGQVIALASGLEGSVRTFGVGRLDENTMHHPSSSLPDNEATPFPSDSDPLPIVVQTSSHLFPQGLP